MYQCAVTPDSPLRQPGTPRADQDQKATMEHMKMDIGSSPTPSTEELAIMANIQRMLSGGGRVSDASTQDNVLKSIQSVDMTKKDIHSTQQKISNGNTTYNNMPESNKSWNISGRDTKAQCGDSNANKTTVSPPVGQIRNGLNVVRNDNDRVHEKKKRGWYRL